MSWDVVLILLSDGIANGAIYLLAGLGMVLIFSVTRVVYIPFGDIAVFSALSLAAFSSKKLPGTIWLVLLMTAMALIFELISLFRTKQYRLLPKTLLIWGGIPVLLCAIAAYVSHTDTPQWLQIIVAILLVVPIAPLSARVFLQPIADASALVLLMAALVMHFFLAGLCLMFMGPEGFRTDPIFDGTWEITADLSVSYQTVLMVVAAIVLSLMFFLLFERTLTGKSLRATAVNRVGARLVGIRPTRTAMQAYIYASLLAGLIGVLIAPVTTLYYDSGFTIGLKAFVAAIIGGLSSYPITAIGGLVVGVLESFGSFWSGALKDVIVFSVLIPVLLVRSYHATQSEEDGEEIDQ